MRRAGGRSDLEEVGESNVEARKDVATVERIAGGEDSWREQGRVHGERLDGRIDDPHAAR